MIIKPILNHQPTCQLKNQGRKSKLGSALSTSSSFQPEASTYYYYFYLLFIKKEFLL